MECELSFQNGVPKCAPEDLKSSRTILQDGEFLDITGDVPPREARDETEDAESLNSGQVISPAQEWEAPASTPGASVSSFPAQDN